MQPDWIKQPGEARCPVSAFEEHYDDGVQLSGAQEYDRRTAMLPVLMTSAE